MKNPIICICAILLFSLRLFSQETHIIFNPHSSVTIDAPQFSKIGPLASPTVSENTGALSYSYQLTDIKCGNHSLPVLLSYSTGGFKPTDYSSEVGLGWDVGVGASISRMKNGLPDDGLFGYWVTPPIVNHPTKDYLNFVVNGHEDTRPDVFRYNLPSGESGAFLFPKCLDQNNNTIPMDSIFQFSFPNGDCNIAVQFPVQDIKIERFYINNELCFQITNKFGVKYIFTEREYYHQTIDDYFGQNPLIESYISSWYLTEVKFPDITDKIILEYISNCQYNVSGDLSSESISFVHIPNGVQCSSPSHQSNQKFYSAEVREKKQLSRIHTNFSDQEIVFLNSSTQREDEFIEANTTCFALEKIIKKINGNEYSCFEFITGYFPGAKRLRLNRVKFGCTQTGLIPDLVFEYNNFSLPSRTTKSIDHWGYYNGQSNQGLIPSSEKKYFDDLGFNVHVPYCIRDATDNPQYYGIGLLNKIYDPNGNITEIKFEPHDYIFSGGTRIEEENLNYHTVANLQCLSTDTLESVFVSNHNGTILFRIEVIGGHPPDHQQFEVWLDGENVTTLYKETGVFEVQKTFSPGVHTVKLISYSLSGYQWTLKVDYTYTTTNGLVRKFPAGGVRVKELTETGVSFNQKKIFNYELSGEKGVSSGVLGSRLEYHTYSETNVICTITPGIQTAYLMRIYSLAASRQATINTSYDHPVTYKEVKCKIETDDGTYSTLKKYNTPAYASNNLTNLDVNPPLTFLFKDPREVYTFDENGEILNKSIFSYTYDFTNEGADCMAVRVNINHSDLYQIDFDYYKYFLKGRLFRLVSQEDTKYFPSEKELVSTTTYNYKPNSNIITSTSVTGLDESNTTNVKYVEDITPTPIFMSKDNAHMIGVPLEIEILGQKRSRTKIVYGANHSPVPNNLILPISIYNFNYGTTNEWNSIPEMQVVGYTPKGLPSNMKYRKFKNPNEHLLSIIYTWTPFDKLESIINTGRIIEYEYNDLYQLEKIISPDGQELNYAYDALQRLASIGQDQKFETEYTYSYAEGGMGENKVESTTDYNGANYNHSSKHVFDGLGRVIYQLENGYRESIVNYDGFGRVKSSKSANNTFMSSYLYQPGPSNDLTDSWVEGWPKGMEHAIDVDLVNNYIIKETIDENENISREYTNFFGRLMKTEQIVNGVPAVVKYEYDAAGNLVDVETPDGKHYLYEYDGLNQLISKTIPLEGTYEYTYYDSGDMATQTTPAGEVFEYIYNGFGELINTKINNQDAITLTIGTSGINTGKVTSKNVRLLGSNDFIQYQYSYDQFGRLSAESVRHPWGEEAMGIFYDSADKIRKISRTGNLLSSAYNFEDILDYDIFGRQKLHKQRVGTSSVERFLSGTQYNDIDQLTGLRLGGTLNSPLQDISYSYNMRDWLTQINQDCGECNIPAELDPELYDGGLEVINNFKLFFNLADLQNNVPTILMIQNLTEYYYNNQLVYQTRDSIEFNYRGGSGNRTYTHNVTIVIQGQGTPQTIAPALLTQLYTIHPSLGSPSAITLNNPLYHLFLSAIQALHVVTNCATEGENLFAQQIEYISPHGEMINGKSEYTGNINQIKSCIFGREGKETFAFAYDDLSRLTEMYYPESADNDEDDFNVDISYADLVGNIGSIQRNGLIDIDDITGEKTFGLMDDLSFTYSGGLLTNVLESAEPDYGFRGAGGGFSYEYGRMTAGPGITLIEYNELGLPSYVETASGDELTIRYDAEGKKWFQDKAWGVDVPEMYEDVQGMETKVYVNGIEAINGVVDVMYMEHGRVILAGGGELERYEYFLKDHLGNNRVLFTDKDGNGKIDNSPSSQEILEVYSYYPFGMLMEGMDTLSPRADVYQPYKYNGKESLSANVYDYGARIYMPGIGRWNAVDPLADQAPGWTPYRYGFNNPISFIDPDGLFETKAEAKQYAKDNDIKTGLFRSNKINKQSDGSYSIENRSENSFIANDAEFGIMMGSLVSERGVHLRDIGMDGFNELSNPYSGSYNPNATVKIDWADRAYYLGSLLGLASPTAKMATAAKGGIQLTKKTFGHTFTTHGDNMTNFLLNRAKGSGMAQGQFLNNQKAAQFILDNMSKTANGPVNIPIPKGFPARVIMPDGTFKAATHIRLVPGGGGVKTAYPLIP